jgi:3-keto-5-aminohexanoate cleavage enzyme
MATSGSTLEVSTQIRRPLAGRDDDVNIDDIFFTTHGELEHLSAEMRRLGIKPEFEIYNSGQYTLLDHLIGQGLVEPPYLVQWVLGAQNANYATPWELLHLIHELPRDSIFSVIGIGPFHLPLGVVAMVTGGHVRVGMEDNVYFRRGERVESNAQLVERVVRIADELGRSVASPAQARAMLGLNAAPTEYRDIGPSAPSVGYGRPDVIAAEAD